MEQDNEETVVLFRRESTKDFEVTAVFPELPSDYTGHEMTCYAHVGQHSGCAMSWYNETKRANVSEYGALKRELEQLGYNLVVRHRISPQMRAKRYAAAKEFK